MLGLRHFELRVGGVFAAAQAAGKIGLPARAHAQLLQRLRALVAGQVARDLAQRALQRLALAGDARVRLARGRRDADARCATARACATRSCEAARSRFCAIVRSTIRASSGSSNPSHHWSSAGGGRLAGARRERRRRRGTQRGGTSGRW